MSEQEVKKDESQVKTAEDIKLEKAANRLIYTSGLTQLGDNFYTSFVFTMNAIFLTDVALFSPAAAAAIDVGRTVFRAIISPFIGMIEDKSVYEKGRTFGFWLNMSAFMITILYAIQYFIPTFATPGQGWVKVAIIVLAVLAAVANQILNVAGGAYFPSMTKDPNKRGIAAATRVAGKEIGKFLSGILYPLMLAAFTTSTGKESMAYLLVAIIFSFGLYICYFLASRDINKVCSPKKAERKVKPKSIPVKAQLQQLATNKALLLLTVVCVLVIMRNMLAGGMTPYYFKYVAQSMGQFAIYNTVTKVFGLSAILVTPLLVRFIGTKQCGFIGAVGTALSQLLIFPLHSEMQFIVLAGFANLFINIFTCVIVTLFARTADYGEWKYGIKADGTNMAVYQTSVQIAVIVATLVRGWLLTSVGYVANAEPTPELTKGIVTCLASVGFFVLAGAVVLLFVDLGDKRMLQIEKELEEREKAALLEGGDAVPAE
ncbi:MAG: MFS transporter [Clostridiales Family XIII bacterium]|jgi:GPH family glycoside/pentoside/hexuronide:cation symporter|nr:MFS transporter [Clostridiales Family XIII bacterium]